MMRNRIALTVAAALLVLGICVGATDLRGISLELLPVGQTSVGDVHGLHAPGKPACVKCHPRANTSRWASDRLVPDMSTCAECHESAVGVTVFTELTADCRKCHTRLKAGERPHRGEYPRPNIRFSHKAHKILGCASCHQGAHRRQQDSPGRDVVEMKACYRCHERESGASSRCRTCHLIHPDGRMITNFGDAVLTPPGWLKGPSHGEDWVGRHAPTAGADSDFCSSCHREKFCQDCHTGRLRPRIVHPGDWLSSHGVSTRMGNPRCAGCHKSQSFCLTCHRRAGVAPDSPSRAGPSSAGSFHKNQSPAKICRRARYDIAACVSCHSESSCIQCHAVINPHPAGFAKRCKPLVMKNQRACVKCHSDSIWRRCK